MAIVRDTDPTNLHDLALDAQTDIRKLAVGLAHAGAAPAAVAQLTRMADILSDVVKVLAEGPDLGSAPSGQQPPQAAPQAQPSAPPAPAAAQPQVPPQQHAQQAGLHAGVAALHAAMAASAQQRNQPRP